jgi:hypothetical protein
VSIVTASSTLRGDPCAVELGLIEALAAPILGVGIG